MQYVHNDADRSTAEDIILIVSNDERLNAVARAACLEAITEGSGTGDHAELYRDAHDHATHHYHDYVDTAGLYVRDALMDELDIDTSTTSPRELLLAQRLDLNNRAVWAEVADTYMPDPDELDELDTRDAD